MQVTRNDGCVSFFKRLTVLLFLFSEIKKIVTDLQELLSLPLEFGSWIERLYL